MNYTKTTEKVKKYAKKQLSQSRYEHSVRVAELCKKICLQFGIDEEKGYLAGIGHDICKEIPLEDMKSIALKDKNGLSECEKEKPALLHGRAASVVLKSKFGIKDKDILEAVAFHTTGIVGMCDLSIALYISDKVEPKRPGITKEYLENLLSMNLYDMMKNVISSNLDYVRKKGYKISEETLELEKYFREINGKTKG